MFLHSTMLKSGISVWYETHHILHIQISVVEIFSGEKRVTVFLCFLGMLQKHSTVNTEKSALSSYFYQL